MGMQIYTCGIFNAMITRENPNLPLIYTLVSFSTQGHQMGMAFGGEDK
jgi:hypothetical protein